LRAKVTKKGEKNEELSFFLAVSWGKGVMTKGKRGGKPM